MELFEKLGWKAEWRIDKFKDPKGEVAKALQAGMSLAMARRIFAREYIVTERFKGQSGMVKIEVQPKPRLSQERRIGLNEGLAELIDIICGLGTPTKWDASNARLGVGDSNTAPAATQTGLQAVTNKTFKAMDSNYPARTNQSVEFRSTFANGDANYSWQEYTVVNAASDTGKNLNRCISDKGMKASGETWTLSLTITFC
jgi:hypothetical protein